MRFSFSVAFLFVLFSQCPVHADEVVVADKALSGDEIALHDGHTLRLAGIKATSPEAKAFLESAVSGQTLVLQDEENDRYGRIVATASVQGETHSIEEDMLREGLAFLYPATGDERLDPWCDLERKARAAKRGLWADQMDVPSEEAEKLYGKYGFVIGTVAKAERIKNKVYVTFGTENRPDFSIIIAARYLRTFRKQGLDPLEWSGKKFRVRGWINRNPGPAITITDVHQVELVE